MQNTGIRQWLLKRVVLIAFVTSVVFAPIGSSVQAATCGGASGGSGHCGG